jgi:hypothetical protein
MSQHCQDILVRSWRAKLFDSSNLILYVLNIERMRGSNELPGNRLEIVNKPFTYLVKEWPPFRLSRRVTIYQHRLYEDDLVDVPEATSSNHSLMREGSVIPSCPSVIVHSVLPEGSIAMFLYLV